VTAKQDKTAEAKAQKAEAKAEAKADAKVVSDADHFTKSKLANALKKLAEAKAKK
jgi:hypothetical protein